MITESLGVLSLGLGVPAAALGHGEVGRAHAAGHRALSPAHRATTHRPLAHAFTRHRAHGEGGGGHRAEYVVAITPARRARRAGLGDWLTLVGQRTQSGSALTALSPPPGPSSGGALPPRGSAVTGAITPLRLPRPVGLDAGSSSSLVSAAAPPTTTDPTRGPARPSHALPVVPAGAKPVAPTRPLSGANQAVTVSPPVLRADSIPPDASGGTPAVDDFAGLLPSNGVDNSVAMAAFPYFPLYTLDYADGTVFFPGGYQYATIGGTADGWVDLRAQVRGTTVSTYSWNTTGLTRADAASITGASTYHLQFKWGTGPADTTNSVTLTVTDVNGHAESQTYNFAVPAGGTGTRSGGGPTYTWPETLAPDLTRPEAPGFDSHDASVDADGGALDATIALPAYNPNVAPLALTYDSLAADPRPIVVEHHILADSQSIPTKVSAQLTFNGAAGSTYYYDTSQFIPGDVQQVGLQANATSLATGRYSYTVAVTDYRTTNTTTTPGGTATVLNESGNASSGVAGTSLGAGWTLAGLERITTVGAPASGVVLGLGGGGRSLWFAGANVGGTTYTRPAGEFSTLTAQGSSGGITGFTRTLTDGTVYNFDSTGRETAVVDRNGLRANSVSVQGQTRGKLGVGANSGGKLGVSSVFP